MRQIKDALRPKVELELRNSHQHIAASLGISKGVAVKDVNLASKAGLSWPQIEALDEMLAFCHRASFRLAVTRETLALG